MTWTRGATIAALALGVIVGGVLGRATAPDTQTVTEVEHRTPEGMRELLQDISARNFRHAGMLDQAQNQIEALENRDPDVIVRTDTLYLPEPDTAATDLRLTDDGTLSLAYLIQVSDSADRWTPEVARFTDIWECEEGFAVSATGLLLECDKAQLGHLRLFGGPFGELDSFHGWAPEALGAEAGVQWLSSYRGSPWAAEASLTTQGRARIGVRKYLDVTWPF